MAMFSRTLALGALLFSQVVLAEVAPANDAIQFQIVEKSVNFTGPCLTALEAKDGGAVTNHQCTTGEQQRAWTVVKGGAESGTGPAGPIKIFNNFCLDVTNGKDISGSKLQIWTCAEGNTNQMWTVNGDNTIRWAGHNKCVDLTGGNQADGTPIQIWNCTDNNPNQEWNANEVTKPVTRFLSDKGSGLCISAGATTNGSPVEIAACSDPSTSHVWFYPQSGHGNRGSIQLDHTSKCLDVTNGVNAPGTKLQLWDCDTTGLNQNQQWGVNQNGTIMWEGINQKFPMCVDLTNGQTLIGNQLQIWNCTGGPNQIWFEIEPTLGTY